MGAPQDADMNTVATATAPATPTETPAKETTPAIEAHIALGDHEDPAEPETMTDRTVVLVDNAIDKATFDLTSAILALRGSVLNGFIQAEMKAARARALEVEANAAEFINSYAEGGANAPTLEAVENVVALSLATRYIARMFYHVMSPLSMVVDKHDLLPAISELKALIGVYSADEQHDARDKTDAEGDIEAQMSRTDSLKLAVDYLTAVVKDETLAEGVEDAKFYDESEIDDDIDTTTIDGVVEVIGQQEQSPVAEAPTTEAEEVSKGLSDGSVAPLIDAMGDQ